MPQWRLLRRAFDGEAPLRISTATAMTNSSISSLDKAAVVRVLHEQPAFSELFTAYFLARNVRIESDLIDQLLTRARRDEPGFFCFLPASCQIRQEGGPQPLVADISQETLAEMIGTTRSRVSFFMNKFRKLGFIEYNGYLQVHSSLLSVCFV